MTRKSTLFVFILAAIDLVSKYVASQVAPYASECFYFVVQTNALWFRGLLENNHLSTFVLRPLIAGIIYLVFFKKVLAYARINKLARAAATLILSGALGNGLETLVRGEVIDFLVFPCIMNRIFNIADIYAVVGVVIMLYVTLSKDFFDFYFR